jgi:hypothetical protein
MMMTRKQERGVKQMFEQHEGGGECGGTASDQVRTNEDEGLQGWTKTVRGSHTVCGTHGKHNSKYNSKHSSKHSDKHSSNHSHKGEGK